MVAAIGKWKHLEAFNKHYVRLNAAGLAGAAVAELVHTASTEILGASDSSHTPQGPVPRGGSEGERAHRRHVEPARPTLKRRRSHRPASPQQPAKVPRVQGVSSRGRPTARFLDFGVTSAYDAPESHSLHDALDSLSNHGVQELDGTLDDSNHHMARLDATLNEPSSSSDVEEVGCAVHTQLQPEAPRGGPVVDVDLDVVLDVFFA